MAAAAGPELPGFSTSLFDHALHLHAEHPDTPLPGDGAPYPDDAAHRGGDRPAGPDSRRAAGVKAAAVLEEYFSRSNANPSELEFAFHDVDVPINWNEHVIASAWRADERLVRETGRWLVRHSRDQCSVTIGLALLASDHVRDADVSLIRMIALLSNQFAPLAVRAFRHPARLPDLLWLADRTSGWGRVYVVETLCEYAGFDDVRFWLLRRSCDGDFLNGYFAGKVAVKTFLREAISGDDADDELIDHTGPLLSTMASCNGMGITLASYPGARAVIAAHVRHLGRQRPTSSRWRRASVLTRHLNGEFDKRAIGFSDDVRQRMAEEYRAILSRPEWLAVADGPLAWKDDS